MLQSYGAAVILAAAQGTFGRSAVVMTKIFVVVLAVLAIAPPGNASIVAVGGPEAGHSWSQGFNESGVGNFDLVVVRMVSVGDYFETPAHSGFSDGAWALSYENTPPTPTIAAASGSATTNLTWNITFIGTSDNPLNFDFVAFNGETVVESANADWNGSGWTITAGTWYPVRSEVPEPMTLGLLGLGGLLLRRRMA